jgi:hypothetical protein
LVKIPFSAFFSFSRQESTPAERHTCKSHHDLLCGWLGDFAFEVGGYIGWGISIFQDHALGEPWTSYDMVESREYDVGERM